MKGNVGTLWLTEPKDKKRVDCKCGLRGTFHLVHEADGKSVFLTGWVIVWYNPETKTGSVQKYNGYRPERCLSCEIKEYQRRNVERDQWLAAEATEKVLSTKRSWLNRILGW